MGHKPKLREKGVEIDDVINELGQMDVRELNRATKALKTLLSKIILEKEGDFEEYNIAYKEIRERILAMLEKFPIIEQLLEHELRTPINLIGADLETRGDDPEYPLWSLHRFGPRSHNTIYVLEGLEFMHPESKHKLKRRSVKSFFMSDRNLNALIEAATKKRLRNNKGELNFSITKSEKQTTGEHTQTTVIEGTTSGGNPFKITFELDSQSYINMNQSGLLAAIANLFRNIRGHGGHGRKDPIEIHVRVTNQRRKKARSKKPDQVSIEISDNGRGIRGTLKDEIWKFGASTKTRDESNNRGIGLAINKILIERRMKGKIRCSRHGGIKRGARFTMKFPRVA